MWLASPEKRFLAIRIQFSVDSFNAFRSTAAGETASSC